MILDLPKPGRKLAQRETFGVIESVKAASDLFAPVGGTIAAINDKLASNPELVNSDPYGEGWIMKMKISNLADVDKLLDSVAYEAEL